MIGYFGDIIFETSDRKILNFRDLKRTASASYSDHKRYGKKPEREFVHPNNEGVTFLMNFKAGHSVSPRKMMEKVIDTCNTGKVCSFVLGGRKVAGGRWTIDNVGADYNEVWNRGELVSASVSVTATEYN